MCWLLRLQSHLEIFWHGVDFEFRGWIWLLQRVRLLFQIWGVGKRCCREERLQTMQYVDDATGKRNRSEDGISNPIPIRDPR
ncbi:hypothetical protein DVH24_005420 [Malus domestica]|uniref:Uncharacterized protein n=1 Tax=Malus domestica TaxID=3750 RepID=A0A498KJK3_MALDO|nr:hypothetical protein DVH24_005420 [Malus domestica]